MVDERVKEIYAWQRPFIRYKHERTGEAMNTTRARETLLVKLPRWLTASYLSINSIGSVLSILSLYSAGSVLSIGSAGSLLSIGSSGSILSIGSAGSILSIGSAGTILNIGGVSIFPGKNQLTERSSSWNREQGHV